jgi:peptidoglycan hydrolase-like protein with peptidoglycan-binding domain
VCRLDGAARVDVQAVAHWQTNHALPGDGKIGPHTVQKAREVKASKRAEVAAAPQADARPPV